MRNKAREEINRMKELLFEFGISEKKVRLLEPVIENTAWMKVKLDEARKIVKNSSVVIPYDNGGGQEGIRENPIFKGYEALWKSYMSGMNALINCLPDEAAKAETEKAENARSVLEIVRAKHEKQA